MSWKYLPSLLRNRDSRARRTIVIRVVAVICGVAAVGMSGIFEAIPGRNSRSLQGPTSPDFDELNDERDELIRSGVCQFNKRGVETEIEHFLREWNCVGNEENMTRLPLLLVGDSHSADKVVALRLNGYDVAAMGGARCSLMPSKMKDTCREQFDFAKSWVSQPGNDIAAIGLSERFKKDELNVEAFKEMVEYWTMPGKKLIIFTKMPRFKGLQQDVEARTDSGISSSKIKLDAFFGDAAKSEKVAAEMGRLYNHVSVINTRDLFCSLSTNCNWQKDGRSLLTDGGHLSRFGAQLLGERLAAELTKSLE
jgi:hypothetical protein